jgi:hypothetical protein
MEKTGKAFSPIKKEVGPILKGFFQEASQSLGYTASRYTDFADSQF